MRGFAGAGRRDRERWCAPYTRCSGYRFNAVSGNFVREDLPGLREPAAWHAGALLTRPGWAWSPTRTQPDEIEPEELRLGRKPVRLLAVDWDSLPAASSSAGPQWLAAAEHPRSIAVWAQRHGLVSRNPSRFT